MLQPFGKSLVHWTYVMFQGFRTRCAKWEHIEPLFCFKGLAHDMQKVIEHHIWSRLKKCRNNEGSYTFVIIIFILWLKRKWYTLHFRINRIIFYIIFHLCYESAVITDIRKLYSCLWSIMINKISLLKQVFWKQLGNEIIVESMHNSYYCLCNMYFFAIRYISFQ